MTRSTLEEYVTLYWHWWWFLRKPNCICNKCKNKH